jgi:hypothetical protein
VRADKAVGAGDERGYIHNQKMDLE